MAIENFRGHEDYAQRMRQQTAGLLAVDVLPDNNGLFTDMVDVGYLSPGILGGVGAMVLQLGDDVELFANDLPDERGLTRNGGVRFNYESIHSQLITFHGAVSTALPAGKKSSFATGLVLDIYGKDFSGRYFSPKDELTLSRIPGYECALEEAQVDDVVRKKDVVNIDRFKEAELNPTRVMRLAAQWREYTLTGAYDPDKQEQTRTLSVREARKGLALTLRRIQTGQSFRNIDLARQVAPDTRY